MSVVSRHLLLTRSAAGFQSLVRALAVFLSGRRT